MIIQLLHITNGFLIPLVLMSNAETINNVSQKSSSFLSLSPQKPCKGCVRLSSDLWEMFLSQRRCRLCSLDSLERHRDNPWYFVVDEKAFVFLSHFLVDYYMKFASSEISSQVHNRKRVRLLFGQWVRERTRKLRRFHFCLHWHSVSVGERILNGLLRTK